MSSGHSASLTQEHPHHAATACLWSLPVPPSDSPPVLCCVCSPAATTAPCLSVHYRRTNGRLRCPALSPKMKSRFVLRRQPKATGVRPNLGQVRCSEGRP